MSDATTEPDPARVEAIFDAAAELEGDARARHLAEACAGDARLEREVLTLLAHDKRRDDPTTIGRFTITKKLGEGGMGVVYEGYDAELDRKVAIKLVRAERGGGSEGRARLLREAQAMAKLAHPNVAPIYEAGSLEARVFIVMELVEGETLAAWLARETRPVAAVLAMFVDVGRGLAAAHEKGIVHRDFKPANVLVGGDGRPRVVDFGLARSIGLRHDERAATTSASSLDVDLTAAGALVGTPAFMSPEQFRGKVVDARSDQWSFAVALYRALFGVAPFEGDNVRELCANVCMTPARPPPETGAPFVVVDAVLRCLSTDAAARFPSMNDLLAELEKPLAKEALDDAPTLRGRRVAAVVLTLAAALTLANVVASRGPAMTNRDLLNLAVVALAVLAAVGVALRKQLLGNAHGRKVALALAIPCVGFVVHRAAALKLGMPVEATVVGDAVSVGVMSAFAGAFVERWMFAGVVLAALHVAFSIAVPSAAGPAFGAVLVAYSAFAAWRWSDPRRAPWKK